jgi:hypothetical protein
MAARRRPTFVGKRDRSRCRRQTQSVTAKVGSWTSEVAFTAFAQGTSVSAPRSDHRSYRRIGLAEPRAVGTISMNCQERAQTPLDSPSADWHSFQFS